jgi:peptide subunit release factor 1 (eRF1)
MLPVALRAKVIGTVHPSPEWSRNDWVGSVASILEQRRADEEEAALTDLGLYEPRHMLMSGLRDVLEATVLFFVRELFVRDDLSEPGYVCRDHNYAAFEAGQCPFDSSALLPVENVVDELIEMARQHGVSVMVVRQRRDLLDPYGGIAAVEYPGISAA